MKIFTLGAVDFEKSVAVLLNCPQVKRMKSDKPKDWARVARKKRDKAWCKKKRLQYHQCRRLMQLADDWGAKIESIDNIPYIGGNKIQFKFEFGTIFSKEQFVCNLYTLDEKLEF